MSIAFKRVGYLDLNGRQKENYNYHKISAILAEYGFTTIRLSDDWEGADFIAKHIDGQYLLVQQKSRLAFAKKYEGKNLYICCPRPEGGCYFYPHDELLKKASDLTGMTSHESWVVKGGYSFSWSWVKPELKALFEEYKLEAQVTAPETHEI